MRAARFYGKEDTRVEEIDEPCVEREPDQHQTRICVGICGIIVSLIASSNHHGAVEEQTKCPELIYPIILYLASHLETDVM